MDDWVMGDEYLNDGWISKWVAGEMCKRENKGIEK